jgi:hypothetical protein
MCCAVLDRNEEQWKLRLYDRLGLPPLPFECRESRRIEEQKRIQLKLWVTSPQYVEERRQEKREEEQAEAQAPKRTGYELLQNK